MARVLQAIVDVLQAHVARESGRATALVSVDQIEALLAVSALDREALVDVVLAEQPLVTWNVIYCVLLRSFHSSADF